MEERIQKFLRFVLVIALIALLGWYMWNSYMGHEPALSIQEDKVTGHDRLFGIHHSREKTWAVGKYGLILCSGDGGKNWKKQNSGTTRALTAVSFADDQCGFVVGTGGTILATADGGLSWKAQNSGTDEQFLMVQALSKDEVHVVGGFGTLISTADGGKTWNRQTLDWKKLIPRGSEESLALEPNLNGVYFIDPKLGWIIGECGLVLCTKDGGQSWISQRYDVRFQQLCAVWLQDPHTGWAVGQKGTFIRTSDGGRHWTAVNLGTEKDLYAISLHGQDGIIVGDGIAFKTNNGGSTWTKVGSIPDHWFSGVAIASMSRVALAVGQDGAIHLIDLTEVKGGSSTHEK